MSLENLTEYQNAGLAMYLLKSEESQKFLPGALEQLAEDLGVDKKARGFINGAFASEDGLKIATQTYAQDYIKGLKEAKIDELYEHYKPTIDNYLDDDEKVKLQSEFNKYSNKEFGNIMEETEKAKYQIEDKYGIVSDKDKAVAREVLKKYKEIISFINLLEEIKFENLRPKATERTYKEILKQSVKDL